MHPRISCETWDFHEEKQQKVSCKRRQITKTVQKKQHCRRENYFTPKICCIPVKLQCSSRFFVCGNTFPPNNTHQARLCLQGAFIAPGSLSSSAAFSSAFSSSQLKANLSLPHTFPLFQNLVQTFHEPTGNHPWLGIMVPVVLCGGCISVVSVVIAASLCPGKTTVPSRLCGTVIWRGKRMEEQTVICPSSHFCRKKD